MVTNYNKSSEKTIMLAAANLKTHQTVKLSNMVVPIGSPNKRLILVTILEHWLIRSFCLEKTPDISDGNQG